MKKIGILAGMGPRSTAPFLELVLDEAEKHGAVYDIDYPHIVIYSLPTPFYVDRPLDHDAMRSSLKIGIQSLVSARIDVLAIPCNSVHFYFDYMLSEIKNLKPISEIVPLHIVDEVMHKIPSETKKAVLLATQSTIDSRVYHERLETKGIKILHTKALQEEVNSLILALKREGFRDLAKKLFGNILSIISNFECKVVIIACTDITLCLTNENSQGSFVFLDSSKILAEATYSTYRKISRRSNEYD